MYISLKSDFAVFSGHLQSLQKKQNVVNAFMLISYYVKVILSICKIASD